MRTIATPLRATTIVAAFISLTSGCGSGEGETTAPEFEAASVQLDTAFRALESSEELSRITASLASADSDEAVEEDARSLQEVGRGAISVAGEGAAADPPSEATESIERAGLRLQDAGASLEQVAEAMSRARRILASEQTASAEASEEASAQAKELERLQKTLDQSKDAYLAALIQLELALDALEADLADSAEQTAPLADRLARLQERAGANFAELNASLVSLAERLTDRASELEPDLVLDCTSQYFPNVSDMSVRNMSCEEADALTNAVIQVLGAGTFYVSGYACSILGTYGPTDGSPILGASDIRCYAGDQAFRFSFGD